MVIIALLLVLLAGPAWAIEEFTGVILHSGAIANGTGATVPVTHYGTAGLDVAITNTATVTFKSRSAGTHTYKDIRCLNTATGAVGTTATATGNYQCPVAGLIDLRAPITDCASCVVSVAGQLTTATISGLASLSGGGGTQYAEDTAHVSGDQMTMMGAVQQSATAALAADGDRTVLQVDGNGHLKVVNQNPNLAADNSTNSTTKVPVLVGTVSTSAPTFTNGNQAPLSLTTGGSARVECSNCSGSGVTHTDNAAFTGGTDDVAPMGALYDTTPPAITDGSLGAPRMDSSRYLYTNCVVGCSGGATTPTDNFANPTTAGLSFGFNAWWDGATWDRAPGNSTDGLLVNLGTNNDVTVTSGSITANAGTNLNTSALALEAGNLATIAGVVDATASTVPANALVVGGTDGTNTRMLKTDTGGELQVDVLTLPSVTIDTFPDNEPINVAQMNGVAITMGNGVSGTGVQRVTIASDSTGTVAVTQATASSLNAQVVGAVAHDVADSGNPIKIGCHARTTNRTAVSDADRADVVCDDNGQLIVTPMAPRDRVVRSGVITLTNTTETTLVAAGGAGVFRDLTYLKCTNNSATLVRVDLRDATAGTVIDSWALAASGGGFNLAWSVPYAQATANNNWTVQLSASVTDVRCSAQAVEKN